MSIIPDVINGKETTPHSSLFIVERSSDPHGHGFTARGETTISGLSHVFQFIADHDLVAELASDAQTAEKFVQKLKNIRNQPRLDYVFINYKSFTLAITLYTHPDEIKDEKVQIGVAVYNKLRRNGWPPSAPAFKTEKQAREARALLDELVMLVEK